MKFKVGDRVRVKKDLVGGKYYGKDDVYFAYNMEPLRGKIFTVEYYTDPHYVLKDAESWEFNETMLEAVDDIVPEKFVIYRENNKTIAKYYKGNNIITSEAKCSPEDEFDFETGAKLAMDRAIKKMKEEEVGYSWVRCVGYRQNHEFNFIVGKEYKIFDNGKIVNENGFNYQRGYVNSSKEETLEFLNKWYIFEEIS